jgi:hypothetical protein
LLQRGARVGCGAVENAYIEINEVRIDAKDLGRFRGLGQRNRR